MQPYTGALPADNLTAQTAQEETVADYGRWDDARNLLILLAGCALVLLLVPPQHEYPIIDDWIYASAVRDMHATGAFTLPPMSQANLIGQALWGLAWVNLLGFSFTTLTFSTLALALVALLSFYAIARTVGVPPWGALLGAGLLAVNPLFLHLSYSFMTDVPFLAFVLAACYCYIRGLKGNNLAWLLAGSLLAGGSYLIRQFGILVPVPFVLYLAVESLRTRRMLWREAVAAVAIPVLAFFGWYMWAHDKPPNAAQMQAAGQQADFMFKDPWLRTAGLRALSVLPLMGFFAWAAVRLKRRWWWLAPAWLVVVIWGMYALDLPNETWLPPTEAPFFAQIGSLSVQFPFEVYTFGIYGNILRVGGIDFFEYDQQAIWSPEAWHLVWLVGVGLGVLLLAKMTAVLFPWFKAKAQGEPLKPLSAFYLLGFLTFVASVALPGAFFDRYGLGFLPFLILFVVRGSKSWSKWAWRYSVAAFALLALFSVLLKADSVSHDNARWQAGQWVYQRSGGLHGGYDWDNWVGGRNDAYQIADKPLDGYRIEKTFPYTSLLSGFATRYVYAQTHSDLPPLP